MGILIGSLLLVLAASLLIWFEVKSINHDVNQRRQAEIDKKIDQLHR